MLPRPILPARESNGDLPRQDRGSPSGSASGPHLSHGNPREPSLRQQGPNHLSNQQNGSITPASFPSHVASQRQSHQLNIYSRASSRQGLPDISHRQLLQSQLQQQRRVMSPQSPQTAQHSWPDRSRTPTPIPVHMNGHGVTNEVQRQPVSDSCIGEWNPDSAKTSEKKFDPQEILKEYERGMKKNQLKRRQHPAPLRKIVSGHVNYSDRAPLRRDPPRTIPPRQDRPPPFHQDLSLPPHPVPQTFRHSLPRKDPSHQNLPSKDPSHPEPLHSNSTRQNHHQDIQDPSHPNRIRQHMLRSGPSNRNIPDPSILKPDSSSQESPDLPRFSPDDPSPNYISPDMELVRQDFISPELPPPPNSHVVISPSGLSPDLPQKNVQSNPDLSFRKSISPLDQNPSRPLGRDQPPDDPFRLVKLNHYPPGNDPPHQSSPAQDTPNQDRAREDLLCQYACGTDSAIQKQLNQCHPNKKPPHNEPPYQGLSSQDPSDRDPPGEALPRRDLARRSRDRQDPTRQDLPGAFHELSLQNPLRQDDIGQRLDFEEVDLLRLANAILMLGDPTQSTVGNWYTAVLVESQGVRVRLVDPRRQQLWAWELDQTDNHETEQDEDPGDVLACLSDPPLLM